MTFSTGKDKKQLGQYYTTNYDYMLSGFEIPDGVCVVEPFCGTGELLNLCNDTHTIEMYDIDPKVEGAIQQDTLSTPPVYAGKYVITNPPYLSRNKSKDKELYDRYKLNDLYKIFIDTLCDGKVFGGLIIIPLNFLSENRNSIRRKFFTRYHITKVRVFEETVFDDTSYTVMALQFELGEQSENTIDFSFFPSKDIIPFVLSGDTDWVVGGEVREEVISGWSFGRLMIGGTANTNLFLYAVDGGTHESRIRLTVSDEPFYGKDTDRAFMSITSNKPIPPQDEQRICDEFNTHLEAAREKYKSLFLVNFRNSTKFYARKRIDFTLCFRFLKRILNELYKVKPKPSIYDFFD